MAAVATAPAVEDAEGGEEPPLARRALAMVSAVVFSTLFTGGIAMQSRMLYALEAAEPLGEAQVAVARRGIALATSLGSVTEFFIGPILSRLSDRTGRRPLFFFYIIVPMLTRLLAMLVPGTWLRVQVLCLDQAGMRAAGVPPMLATTQTMISDLVPAAAQPRERSRILAAQALGLVLGSYTGGWCNAKFSPTVSYGVCVAINAATLGLMAKTVPETHPRLRDRPLVKPSKAEGAPEPEEELAPRAAETAIAQQAKSSGAFRTIMSDPRCGLLATIAACHEMMVISNINEVAILLMRERLQWGPLQTGTFMSGYGMATFVGSMVTAPLVDFLGRQWQVTMAHVCTAIAFALWGAARNGSAMVACLVPLALGHGRSVVVQSDYVARAAELGIPTGAATGVAQALGATSKAVMPVLLMRLYTKAMEQVRSGRGYPRMPRGSPMLFISVVTVLLELLHQVLVRLDKEPRKLPP